MWLRSQKWIYYIMIDTPRSHNIVNPGNATLHKKGWKLGRVIHPVTNVSFQMNPPQLPGSEGTTPSNFKFWFPYRESGIVLKAFSNVCLSCSSVRVPCFTISCMIAVRSVSLSKFVCLEEEVLSWIRYRSRTIAIHIIIIIPSLFIIISPCFV